MKVLRIATRQSALALWQAEHVAARLREVHPGLLVELLPMTTRGDQILDRPLAQIGGKGLFMKELEVAISQGLADIAVHSMKDVPMQLEQQFEIAAVLEREEPFDALVSPTCSSIAALPEGARVGTSSLRRTTQLRAARSDLNIVELRGNVNTRLAKLDAGEYDAIVLACAGLIRLGLGDRISSRLELPDWLPAVAQGAIGIQARADDQATLAMVAPLSHLSTSQCVAAERAMNSVLLGSCDVPIAGFARLQDDTLTLHGMVGDAMTGQMLRATRAGPVSAPEQLGKALAAELIAKGANQLLHRPS